MSVRKDVTEKWVKIGELNKVSDMDMIDWITPLLAIEFKSARA